MAGCPKCCQKRWCFAHSCWLHPYSFCWQKLHSSPQFTVICPSGPHFLGLFFWHWDAGANIVLSRCGQLFAIHKWSGQSRNFNKVDMGINMYTVINNLGLIPTNNNEAFRRLASSKLLVSWLELDRPIFQSCLQHEQTHPMNDSRPILPEQKA